MIAFFALIGFQTSHPARDIDLCVAAHSRLTVGSVDLAVVARLESGAVSTNYELDYVRPSSVRLTVRKPPTAERAASTRTFLIQGDRLLAYDWDKRQYIDRVGKASRPTRRVNDLDLRLSTAIGGLDDAIAVQLNPESLRQLLQNFRLTDGWRRSSQGDLVVWSRKKLVRNLQTLTELKFDARSHLLRHLKVGSTQRMLEWACNYRGKPKAFSAIPAGSKRVEQFVDAPAPPNYKDATAKRALRGVSAAMLGLKNAAIDIDANGLTSHYWKFGQQLRGVSNRVEWTYDGRRLRVADAVRGIEWSGRCTVDHVPEWVDKAGGLLDPFFFQIVLGRSVLRSVLAPHVSVRSIGSIGAAGNQVDLVEIVDGRTRTQIEIGVRSRLVQAMTTTISDSRGIVSRSTKRIQYSRTNAAMRTADLRLHTKAKQVHPLGLLTGKG